MFCSKTHVLPWKSQLHLRQYELKQLNSTNRDGRRSLVGVNGVAHAPGRRLWDSVTSVTWMHGSKERVNTFFHLRRVWNEETSISTVGNVDTAISSILPQHWGYSNSTLLLQYKLHICESSDHMAADHYTFYQCILIVLWGCSSE